jgi:hypothetical protein
MKITKKRVIISIVVLIVILVGALSIKLTIDYNDYIEYMNTYNTLSESLESQKSSILKLQDTEYEEEDYLYEEIYEYYSSIESKSSKTTSDKVFCRVFLSSYPSAEDVNTNREDSYIKVYALIEKYPEVKEYGEVSTIIDTMVNNTMELDESVSEYNNTVDEYTEAANTVNNSNWVKIKSDKAVEVKYSYIVMN